MDRDTEISRQRPWSCGPNKYKHFSAGQCRIDLSRIAAQRELHINRRARVMMIFNFSFSQGGLILDAPVNRPRAFVNETTLNEARKHSRGLRFVVVRHREIWFIPLAKDAESLEV